MLVKQPQVRLLVIGIALCATTFAKSEIAKSEDLPSNPYSLDDQKSCGPMCLKFVDAFFHGTSTLDEINRLCPPDNFGSSLAQIQRAAVLMGYHVIPFRATAAQLRRLRHPAVVHLMSAAGPGHFVVIYHWYEDRQAFSVFDPPRMLREVSLDHLASAMDGIGLVVSDRTISDSDVLAPSAWPIWFWIIPIVAILVGFGYGRIARGWLSTSLRNLIACMVLFITGACSDNSALIPTIPDSKDYVIDYGTWSIGVPIRHTFTIRNTSDEQIRIVDVKKSCSCQAAVVQGDSIIAPGQARDIEVEITTTGSPPGNIIRDFVVLTDARRPDLQTILCRIQASLEAMAEAVPSQIFFGELSGSVRRDLHVRVKSPELLECYRSVASTHPAVNVVLEHRLAGSLVFSVNVGRDVPVGELTGQITVRMDHPEIGNILVPFVGRRRGDVHVVPAHLTIPKSQLSIPEEYFIRIESEKQQPFRIIDIKSAPGISTRVDSSVSSRGRYRIGVTVDQNRLGAHQECLLIHTDRAGEGVVSCPIIVSEGH